jgi:O-antigen/teichoic acid export membrane protein
MFKRFAGNSFLYLLGMLLTRGFGFLLLPIYTRHLTPSDYGVLSICMAIASALGMIAGLSLDSAVGVYYFRLEPREYRKLLGSVWVAMLIIPLLLMGVLEMIGPPLTSRFLFQVPWSPYLRLAVWISYLSVAPLIPLALLRIEQHAHIYAVFTVASFATTTVLLLYFVAVRGEGVLGSLRAQIIAGAIIAVVSHAMVLRRFQAWRQLQEWFSWKYIVAALRLGVPYLPHVAFMWILNVSDRWILGYFVAMSALGLYTLAYTLGMIGHLFGIALISAYGPLYYERADDEGFRAQLPRLLGGYLLVHTWVALAVSLMAPEILRVMTRPIYYGAASFVPWIAAGYWFFVGIYQLSVTILEKHRRTEWTIVLTGPPALLNVTLNWLFIPRYGVLAAAVNTLLAFVLMAALALLMSRKLDKLPYPWKVIAKMLGVAGITGWLGLAWLSLPNLGVALLVKGALLVAAGLAMARIANFKISEVMALRKKRREIETLAAERLTL